MPIIIHKKVTAFIPRTCKLNIGQDIIMSLKN